MNITIVFIVSMFIMSALILSKVFELKFHKIGLLTKLWAKGDIALLRLSDFLVFKYNRYRKIAEVFIFDFLPSYLYELLVKAKDYVSKKYYASSNDFRGRRILRTNGSVSFFLEKLGEDSTIPSRKV